MKDVDNDEFVEIPNQEKEIKRYISYAKNYLKKDKSITLRVAKKDLEKIQIKSVKTGIPYQTLISSLIRQFANDRITINV
jgi:predicted DNA binding CopG/RHH family protein